MNYYILAAVLILLLVYYTYNIQMSTRKLPPGPLILPIVGSWLSIWLYKPTLRISKIRPWEYLDKISKNYGDLWSASHVNYDAVVIASYELLEEVADMEEYSAKFAHRWISYPRTFGKEMGLIFANSKPLWTEMRKFTIRTLRDFGFGKQYTMHSVITDETEQLIKKFKQAIKTNDGRVQFYNTFSLPVLNVLWCMVAGIRYDYNDPIIQQLLNYVHKLSKSGTFANPLEFALPLINEFLPSFLQLPMPTRQKTYDDIHILSKSLIEARKAEGYYLTNPQNYIDVFLKKIHDTKKDKNSLYTEQQLQAMIGDLLFTGTVTLNATLCYAILYLVLYPEVQKRCQQEIDSVVNPSMAPSMDDVAKMPYFQAFILEVHRCANVVPNPIPRLVPNDWHLRGFVIPKGTAIVSNHYSVNMDESYWGDPRVFRPDRFINDKGEFVRDKRVTVFGFGKRICIAMQVANTIVPLFVASLLQAFDFSIPSGSTPPTTEPEIGISLSPQAFSAKLTLRPRSK